MKKLMQYKILIWDDEYKSWIWYSDTAMVSEQFKEDAKNQAIKHLNSIQNKGKYKLVECLITETELAIKEVF